ncbi:MULTISPECIES: SDR family oxidoreductase [unclassified Leeuwenhoekiella]|uniref:SDR family oxidoreductase n=1 Tax=unclassified Leeuwenhoekiella TaxID=2615029 RepID=UPI000C3F3A7B|nr:MULTISPECIES: SDR family oxidoreductase [unclassified Leeuwenhoekiella]MAW96160.1 NAD(P)-dependent oxidoreductase [Leeuwenhoekiella sp.]MBA80154.1 NAD(P)-dependent oxidoreductase [Leeuwenhoekiella sp.]|tara:strand:+ start:19458 stop:20258 length:801 start_codon:yes stop_codon:yes gene_type:complete
MSTIAIAGMGWLGLPLAARLQELGHQVKGSVTSQSKQEELRSYGLDVYRVEIAEDEIRGEIQSFLDQGEILIILIPPGLRHNTGHNHALRMAQLLDAVEKSDVEKVILISSTGVYDDAQGKVTEADLPQPQHDKGKQLVEVEQLFFKSPAIETTIIRFGGLTGGTRNPVKYLAGRSGLSNGAAPVNLIHREDCIGIILAVIYKNAFGHIINAVHPDHPTKEEYYTRQAQELNLELPQYDSEEEETFKQVDSITLKSVLGYNFQVQP